MKIKYTLLPTPQRMSFADERTIEFGPGSRIAAPGDIPPAVDDKLRRWLRYGSGSTPVTMLRDEALAPEEYHVLTSDREIRVVAADSKGWLYGIDRLRQLSPRGTLPAGEIVDYPALSMRGYHLNFNISTLDFEQGISILDSLARWRINTVLLEYDRRYPYRDHPDIPTPDALTRREVADLVAHAHSLGIEPIPLQQCLGHVEYILKREAYEHLSEENMHRDQFCPLNPKSIEMFKELADDFIELHPGIRYFHIGGDETRRLGVCPKCAPVAAKHGTGELYVDYVTKAVEYIRSRGLIPIIWDDMLCKHPDVIERMPREAVLMYWDYWTTRNPSALFVARPAGMGQVTDSGWLDRWDAELCETERRTIAHFSRKFDLEKDLPEEFKSRFRKYLGPAFPKHTPAFPYLEYYMDMGFQVIGAPTGSGNTSTWRKLPDYSRFAENIHSFCSRIHETKALGLVTTAWYGVPPEALMHGITCTGQFAWQPDIPE